MTKHEFHNALRIMLNLEFEDLERGDVIKRGDEVAWARYRTDPYRFFIKADDPTADRLWRLIELRQIRMPPASELAGSKPLVLYFQTDDDRDDFVSLVRTARPGMAEMVVP